MNVLQVNMVIETLQGEILSDVCVFQSISARFLTAFWWMFCLVILLLYFISLKAALLPTSIFGKYNNGIIGQRFGDAQYAMGIQDLDDFLNDKNTRLGYVQNGAIENILQVAKCTRP